MPKTEALSIHFNSAKKDAGQVVAIGIRPQKLGDSALLEILNHQKNHTDPRLIKLTFGGKYANQRPVRITSSELREYDLLPQEEKDMKIKYLLDLMGYAKLITVKNICAIDSQPEPTLNPSKYSLRIEGDNMVETFQTQELSEEELNTLLAKLAEDTSPKIITPIDEFNGSGMPIFGINPDTDEELIDRIRRSDTIIVAYNILSEKNQPSES